MTEKNLEELDNVELVELLSVLEGLDNILEEQELILKEGENTNENKL